jgi:anti-anti-sigma factor
MAEPPDIPDRAWREALLDALRDALFVMDSRGVVLEVNQGFTELLGYGPEGLPYRPPLPWWPDAAESPEDHAEVVRAHVEVESGQRGFWRIPLRHRDGHRVWVQGSTGVVPGTADGDRRVVGILRDVTADVETARAADRERWLHEASAALAAAGGVDEAAQALARAMCDALGAAGVVVYARERDDPTRFYLAHNLGYPPEFNRKLGTFDLDTHPLTTRLLRTGEAFWLHDRADWDRHYGYLTRLPGMADTQAGIAVPLKLGERIVGALGVRFRMPRAFPAEERAFVGTLVSQAAQAFERAALADARWEIARTLQRSLLPARLPRVEGLGLAAHYESAGEYNQTGGDWYDVIPLNGTRVAIVVGDVVGHGAGAAAVMGLLRAALGAYLLEGHPPSTALRLLSLAAGLLDGARASTAVCLVLDTASGELTWSAAGHPPPLLFDPGSPDDPIRYLSGARGGVLGATSGAAFAVAYTDARITLPPGASVLLYTDGLVERRGEILGEGLDRLAAAVARHPDAGPEELLRAALAGTLRGTRPDDDVALVVARLEAVTAPVTEPPGSGLSGSELSGHQPPASEPAPANPTLAIPAHLEPVHLEPAHLGPVGVPTVEASAEPPVPAASTAERPIEPSVGEVTATDLLRVRWDTDGTLTLRLIGDLDMASVEPLQTELERWLGRSSGRVTIDTGDITYLGSAGIRLIAEAFQIAGDRLRLRVERGSIAANSLALSGFELDGIEV